MNGAPIRVRLLGAVSVVDVDGTAEELTRMPAAVLCRLLAAAGSPVDATTLLRDLWVDQPASGTGAVRVTMRRLRQALENAGLADRLITKSTGWALSIDPAETDVGALRVQVDAATEARRRGNARRARELIGPSVERLALPPLGNVLGRQCFDELFAEIAHLVDRAEIELIDADLALGRPADSIGRAVLRADGNVVDESAISRAVRALVAVGRHAEAVEWCGRHAEALADRGLVPSDSFRALELSVLRHGAEPAGRASRTVFVGRSVELDALAVAWSQAADGARLVVIEGPAGIGKSRLVREFIASRMSLDTRVLSGGCSPEVTVPFEPLVDALAEVGSPLWEQLLDERRSSDEPLAQTLAVTDAICRALIAALDGGGVLVVEDAHWLDAESATVLRMLLRRIAEPVLVVVTVRTPEDRDNVSLSALLADTLDAERLVLRGLDDAEVAGLLRSELGDDAALDLSDLPAGARGNPLVVKALARAARADGGGPHFGRELVNTALEPLFARLGENYRSVLAAAAVVGYRAQLRRVAGVADVDLGTALDAVERAASLGLMRVTDRFDEFLFDHDLVRTAAAAQVTAARLALFHSRAADMLLVETGATPQVVHHLVEAGALIEPSHLASIASEVAFEQMTVGALDMAKRMEAIGSPCVVPGSPEEVRMLAVRAASLGTSGRGDEAIAILERALELSSRLGLDTTTARLIGMRGAVGRVSADEATLQPIRQLCDRLRTAGEVDSLAAALTTLSLLLRLGPHREEARRVSAELTGIARATGDPSHIHHACSSEHHVLFVEAGSVAERRRCSERMFENALASTHGFSLVHSYRTLLNDRLSAGQIAGARSALVEMEAAVRDRAYPLAIFLTEAIEICLRLAEDDLEGLDDEIVRLAALGKEMSIEPAEFTVAGQLFVLRWAQGRLAELVEPLRYVASTSEVVTWQFALALSLQAAGDTDGARSAFATAFDRTVGEPLRDWLWLPEAILAAEVCARLGTDDECEALADVLSPFAELDVVVAEGSVITLGPVARPLAVLLDRCGRRGDAQAWARFALKRTSGDGAALWARVGVRLDLRTVPEPVVTADG